MATIRFEEASAHDQAEARRLLEKAAKRAKSGEFQKAKDIYERVLELDPTVPNARRDLAMTLHELGDKRTAPEQDTGMDLDGPFLTALALFNEERAK